MVSGVIDTTPDLLRQRFEALAPLAEPDMREWAKRLAVSHLTHYESVFTHVNRIASSGGVVKVADVGAVPGYITGTLKEAGFDVEGVDINPARTAGIFLEGGVPCHKVDVEQGQLPFEEGQLDLVLFNEILEHLRINPLHALRETFRVLRPGGSILLSTPNITPFMRWRFLRGQDYQGDIIQEFAKLEKIGHMGHIRLYSQNEVENLLQFAGFEIEKVSLEGQIRKQRSVVCRAMRVLRPHSMRPHLYVWAVKPG